MALTERSLVTVRAVLPSLARNARRPPFQQDDFQAGALRLRRRGGQRQEPCACAAGAASGGSDASNASAALAPRRHGRICPTRRRIRNVMAATAPARKGIVIIDRSGASRCKPHQDLSKICQRGSQRSTTAGPAGCERPAARQPAPPTDKAGPDCKFIHKFGTEPAGTRARLAVRSRHFAFATRAFVHHDQIHPPHTRRRHRQLLRGVLHGGPEPELFLQAADRASPCARCAANCMPCTKNWMPSRRRTGRASSTRRSRRCMAPTSTCCPRNRSGSATRARPAHPPGRGLSRRQRRLSLSPARRAGAMAAGAPTRRQPCRQAAGVERMAAPEPDRGRLVPAVGLADLARPERAAQRRS